MEESIYILFQKYLDGNASTEELKMLHDYFATENDEELVLLIQSHLNSDTDYVDLSKKKAADAIVAERWANISELTKEKKKRSWPKWATVAALLIGLLLVAMYYLNRPEPQQLQLSSIYGSDVLPGSNRATLLLADGTQIELDSSSNEIAVKDQTIVYNNGTIVSNKTISNAILKVPNGGIYRLTLSDGTKVVLNSGSSLSYPLQFSDSVRSVKLEGEGYFEVSPNKAKPFKVKSDNQTLTVLGTHFNIQSYTGETIETTLLEGKVALSLVGTNGNTILVPGQQAIKHDNKYQVRRVNAQEAIAWANNLFVFNNIPLSQIFKNLERWYDVEISYPANLSKESYLIEVPKDRKLSEILQTISDLTATNFKIEGRRITVTAK
ncbi:FecR family protein [uncultured Dysgonomonas sp.]|uniref:FecR family protein n=1 Tax=uncultured Dysgonomonas sp. TaxID=206096 RepID=UPI000AA3D784|nr:FecR family protein [uncultured Dysgonomonas sp.]